ncbi:MAG: cytochrome c maturation protein CcmE [Candidatus Latescibacteria bacterium]|jgi:cytochrome c-type biogenesis protein CcmE|nr:cytochrome c maturation protein CcmE [Candidatus Latescibacterota bacterium]
MKRKQRKFLVGFGVVIAAIGYLIYTGFSDSTMYYLTVSELHASPVYAKNLRLNGHVVTGSIRKDEVGTMRVRFLAEEGGMETNVVYTGVIPDTFKDGSEIVVEGTYAPDGTFTAHTLLAKCPSKYESEGYDDYEPAQTAL